MNTMIDGPNSGQTAHQFGSTARTANTKGSWRRPLLRYVTFVGSASLIWEFAHMPLYTLWETGTPSEIVFAAIHCTGGDMLIAFFAIISAIVIVGNWRRSHERRLLVVTVTVLFGLAYTVFSEWLNIEVRGTWAYRDLMPVIPIINMGLSPFLQWVIVPVMAFRWAQSD